jgi:hypothetical protein
MKSSKKKIKIDKSEKQMEKSGEIVETNREVEKRRNRKR